jgi:CDP-paratose 2-epimerase
MLEASEMAEGITGHQLRWTYSSTSRMGDHIWWVRDLSRFTKHYPTWTIQHRIRGITRIVIGGQLERIQTVTPQ